MLLRFTLSSNHIQPVKVIQGFTGNVCNLRQTVMTGGWVCDLSGVGGGWVGVHCCVWLGEVGEEWISKHSMCFVLCILLSEPPQ